VATREQVRRLLGQGLDYPAAARRLGIPAGQAYLIATGVPADGGDTISDQEMAGRDDLLPVSQQLANPPHHNPTSKESVRNWLKARTAADAQMRTAMHRRTAEPPRPDNPEAQRDAIMVLGRQHNQVRYLLKELQALPSHTTGGSLSGAVLIAASAATRWESFTPGWPPPPTRSTRWSRSGSAATSVPRPGRQTSCPNRAIADGRCRPRARRPCWPARARAGLAAAGPG
jgi:hypothetical protein